MDIQTSAAKRAAKAIAAVYNTKFWQIETAYKRANKGVQQCKKN